MFPKKVSDISSCKSNPEVFFFLKPCRFSPFNFRVISPYGPFKTSTLHLEVLKAILFAHVQFSHMSSNFWALIGQSVMSTISSANPRAETRRLPTVAPSLESLNSIKRSLIKTLNRIGPNLLPCSTPLLIMKSGERKPSTKTFAIFLEKRFRIILNSLPRIPALKSLEKSKLRGTVSNAFFRSRKIKNNRFLDLPPRAPILFYLYSRKISCRVKM